MKGPLGHRIFMTLLKTINYKVVVMGQSEELLQQRSALTSPCEDKECTLKLSFL